MGVQQNWHSFELAGARLVLPCKSRCRQPPRARHPNEGPPRGFPVSTTSLVPQLLLSREHHESPPAANEQRPTSWMLQRSKQRYQTQLSTLVLHHERSHKHQEPNTQAHHKVSSMLKTSQSSILKKDYEPHKRGYRIEFMSTYSNPYQPKSPANPTRNHQKPHPEKPR